MKTSTLQLKLVLLGYGEYLRPYGVDGKMGDKTRKAVRQFQTDYKIGIDGIPGKETYATITTALKNVGKKGTKHFKITEFYSKDGGGLLKGGMDNRLLQKLEQLRYNLGGKPMVVTSGYRTPSHNKAVGGASSSQHLYGRASDIQVHGVAPSKVYSEATKLFDGIGKYSTFTHVDTRGYTARF